MITVLLCDDVAELRSLARRALKDEPDMEVVGEAGDGQEAVEMAADLNPDVILLDVSMPVKDGLTALEEIRAACPDSKIIMFTALQESLAKQPTQLRGADAYVEKGALLLQLVERIRSVTAS